MNDYKRKVIMVLGEQEGSECKIDVDDARLKQSSNVRGVFWMNPVLMLPIVIRR